MRIPSVLVLATLLPCLFAGEEVPRRKDTAPVQLEIRLFEIKSIQNQQVGFDWTTTNILLTDQTDADGGPAGDPSGTDQSRPAIATLSGILTDPQFRTVIRALENREGAVPIIAAQVPAVSGAPIKLQRPDGWLIKVMPKVSGTETELEFEISQSKGDYAGYTFSSTALVPNGQAVVFSDLLPVSEKESKRTRLTLVLEPKL